jgi:cyclophilin family peptidyl-prolyl cis-trans isomerase
MSAILPNKTGQRMGSGNLHTHNIIRWPELQGGKIGGEETRIMSKKRASSRAGRRARRERQRVIARAAAIGGFVLLAAVLLWVILSSQKTQTQKGEIPPLNATKQYAYAPPMLIDTSKQYFATVEMAKGGEFVIQLYADKAPITVNSFVFLARQGYFDGATFHRVLEGFMAQGGDPTGTGSGGPGYKFVNEDSDLTFDKAGVVAMANAGRDTNGSQFFITFAPVPRLNGGYTIFGQVISGMEVVNGITRRDPGKNPTFSGDVMESVTITEE